MQDSKKLPLILLGITAVVLSRSVFSFIDDPEGPNLFVVTAFAFVVYALSLAILMYTPLLRLRSSYKILATFSVQILLVVASYYLMR